MGYQDMLKLGKVESGGEDVGCDVGCLEVFGGLLDLWTLWT